MASQIKESGNGVALQVTKPARRAGLVEENDDDGEPTRRAHVRVYSFDGLLIVADIERLSDAAIADVVATAARDTKSIHRAWDARVQVSGGGYQVQLPPAEDAGFQEGDRTSVHAVDGVLFIVPPGKERLVDDLRALNE